MSKHKFDINPEALPEDMLCLLHAIEAVTGPVMALKVLSAILDSFSGTSVYFPLRRKLEAAARNVAIKEDYRQGMTLRQVARKYNLSNNRTREILFKM